MLNESISIARKRYPSGRFAHGTADMLGALNFDCVLASGIFAVNIENARETYFAIIKDLYLRANLAFGFNMLRADRPLNNAPEIISFNQDDVLKYCKNISNNVRLVQGYLPIDFSVFLFHHDYTI